MSTVALPAPKSYADYVRTIVESDPKTALELALAESDRQRFALQRVQEELRAKSEVELDQHGRFVAHTLAGLLTIGKMYAESGMVPKHYENMPGACAIATQMAMRCKVDVFLFMQNTYPVGNKIGIEAKLVIAMLNASGQIKGRVRWTPVSGTGKDRKCTAYVVDNETGERLEQTVTWEMVEAEGWHKSKGTQTSKWMTLPDLMFQYRSAAFLCRTYYPDVLMGMHTVDEIEDMSVVDSRFAEVAPRTLDALTDRLESRKTVDATALEEATKPIETKAETKQTETAEQSDDSGETTGGELPNPLAGVSERLAECTMLGQVTEIETEIGKLPLDNEQELRLADMCESARARIKESRGAGSNK